jgi:hypothetical protein
MIEIIIYKRLESKEDKQIYLVGNEKPAGCIPAGFLHLQDYCQFTCAYR